MDAVASFATGVLAWSLFEYLTHRFVSHFMDRVCGHHVEPLDYTVGPSWLAVAVAFTLLWCLVAGPFIAGFSLGYLIYARVHFMLHHHAAAFSWLHRQLRRNHNIHHYIDDHVNYGVTSPLWDMVFGTYKGPR